MDINNLKEELKNIKYAQDELYEKLNDITKRKERIMLTIAKYYCPFEVGQKVLNSNDEIEIVDEILPSYSQRGYDLKTKKIKINGEPYKKATRVWFTRDYKAYKAYKAYKGE